jgi:hypothetical protein
MTVSLYSWETDGPVGELVEMMTGVLADRYQSGR